MLAKHHTIVSTAATAVVAALLVLGPAAFAAEPGAEALQEEIDALRAKVALLEQHVIELEEQAGVVPAKLSALEEKGAIARFDLLETRPEQPERQPFGKL